MTDNQSLRAAAFRKAQRRAEATAASDNTREAHDVLANIAESQILAGWIADLSRLQLASEDEGWWEKDLGIAIEYTLGYAKMLRDRAAAR